MSEQVQRKGSGTPRLEGAVMTPALSAAQNRLEPQQLEPEEQGEREERDRDRDGEVLERMRKRFALAQDAFQDDTRQALDDARFAAGEQWAQGEREEREGAFRPCLTINKLPTFISQLVNDQRMNSPQVRVVPSSDETDAEAARIYTGLIRAIERDSAAEIAYDTAFESAVRVGFGFIRLVTEYEAPDSFAQVLRIRRIRNPFSVLLDPYSQQPDGSDAQWCFVSDMVPREEFEATWPEASAVGWTSGDGEMLRPWMDDRAVRVAEYFEVQEESAQLVRLSSGAVAYRDALSPEVLAAIEAGTLQVQEERETSRRRVMWYRCTAHEILERQEWPSTWLPIVKVPGQETDIAGKLSHAGLVRWAKDPQRLYNYWASQEAEAIALIPKAPFIIAEGQLAGYEDIWRNANRGSPAFLPYREKALGGSAVPPPQRVPPAGPPEGILAAKQGAAQDMQATTGIRFDATQSERMIDESGRAIRELRRSGDLTNFHYLDNLARAKRHVATIILEMAPRLLESRAYAQVLREDDSDEMVEIDTSSPKAFEEVPGQDGRVRRLFNPRLGRYGVVVAMGPSYATKRIEASEQMMALARSMPALSQAAPDLLVKLQDWPGADAIARRLARTIPPGLLEPDRKDLTPQVQALLGQLQQQLQQAQMQNQQLQQAVQDREQDRSLLREKIARDFQAKVLQVMTTAKTEDGKLELAAVSRLLDVAREETEESENRHKPTKPGENQNVRAGSAAPEVGVNPSPPSANRRAIKVSGAGVWPAWPSS